MIANGMIPLIIEAYKSFAKKLNHKVQVSFK